MKLAFSDLKPEAGKTRPARCTPCGTPDLVAHFPQYLHPHTQSPITAGFSLSIPSIIWTCVLHMDGWLWLRFDVQLSIAFCVWLVVHLHPHTSCGVPSSCYHGNQVFLDTLSCCHSNQKCSQTHWTYQMVRKFLLHSHSNSWYSVIFVKNCVKTKANFLLLTKTREAFSHHQETNNSLTMNSRMI